MVAFNDPPAREPELPDVDLRPVPRPIRSIAFSLKPLAVGTGMVESLRGYLVRLAAAHCLRFPDLFWKILAPLAHLQESRSKAAYIIPLKGERALQVVSATEAITMQSGLERTTLSRADRYSCVLVNARERRTWCPSCLESDERPYDRLLWQLAAVDYCPLHRMPLRERCPACHRRQRFSAMGLSILNCACCGASLTAVLPGGKALLANDYQVWAAKEAARFLAYYDGPNANAQPALLQNLKLTMTVFGGRRALAQVLQVGVSSLHGWEHGRNRMFLEIALRWSWVTGLAITDLLGQQVSTSELKVRSGLAVWTRRMRPVRKSPTIEAYLKALAEFLVVHPYEVPTKRMLVQQVGGTNKHPAINMLVVIDALNATKQQRRLLRKKQMAWAIVCRVYKAFDWAERRGFPLTSRNICRALDRGGDMVSPLARKYFSVLKQQHTRGHKMSDPSKRVPQDVQEFWAHYDLS